MSKLRTLYTGLHAFEAPEYLQRMLLVRGGENPYGEPMYRLVRTEGRKRIAGGRWHEWSKGTDIRYRNPDLNRCLRSYVGMKAVPMYPGEHGWALERWMPPSMSRVQWYLPMDMGGTKRWMGLNDGYVLACGDYPERGDWEGTEYMFPTSPNDRPHERHLCDALSESVIANAVGRIEVERDGMPKDPLELAMREIRIGEEQEAQEERESARHADEVMADDLDFMNVHSVGARAEAHRFAESKGIRSEIF